MVVFTDFLPASRAIEGGSMETWRENLPAQTLSNEQDNWYYGFHAHELTQSKDNLVINSLCLPVFATPLSVLRSVEELQNGHIPADRVENMGNLPGYFASGKKRGRPPRVEKITDGNMRSSSGSKSRRNPSSVCFGAPEPAIFFRSNKPKSYPNAKNNERTISSNCGSRRRKLTSNSNVSDGKLILTSKKLKESYVSRSGRKTSLGSYKEENLKISRQDDKPRRKPGPVNKNVPFQVGPHEYYDEIIVTDSAGSNRRLHEMVVIDDLGVVQQIKNLSYDSSETSPGILELRCGDILNVPLGTSPLRHLRTSSILHFTRVHSRNFNRIYALVGEPIYPTKLYDAVQCMGGFDSVCNTRQWQLVREKLGLQKTTSSSSTLRRVYEIYFLEGLDQ